MDYVLPVVAAVTLVILVAAGYIMTLLSLPGNWLIVIGVAVYRAAGPRRLARRCWLDHRRHGADHCRDRRAARVADRGAGHVACRGQPAFWLLALGGSLAGGLVGAVAGLPIPVVGSVLAIVLFAAVGVLAGAMLGESWQGRPAEVCWQVGRAAFWGLLLGTTAKIIAACLIVVVVGLALAPR